jgi:cytochrome oxidase assembly protein ShyY1
MAVSSCLLELLYFISLYLVVITPSLDEIQELEYRKVVVRGKFDHSKELLVVPRTPVAGTLPESSPGRSGRKLPDKAQSGANVITAFNVDSSIHPK